MARQLSTHVRVLIGSWHRLVLDGERPRLGGPFLELEDGEQRAFAPREPVDVDALWFFPVAGGSALDEEELVAARRLAARAAGSTAVRIDAAARALFAAACREVVTNAPGPLARLGRKDQLEYALRRFTRATGRRIRRPDTEPAVGARLAATLRAFGGRDCIVKPANAARGESIAIVAGTATQPPADSAFPPAMQLVVQELVTDPLVIAGTKTDLRCYLLVDVTARSRSCRIGPVLARGAAAPYRRLDPAAEITNTSYRRRLGLAPSIRPLAVALADDQATYARMARSVDRLCAEVLDFVFDVLAAERLPTPPRQVMIWGIDVLPSGRLAPDRLDLLEINIYPQLYRNDRLCDALIDQMLIADYLPAVIAASSRTARVARTTCSQ